MKLCRIVSLAVVLLGLSGCPSEPICSIGTVPPPAVLQTNIIVMGEQVRLSISPNSQAICDPGAEMPVPQSLTVEVYGPDNQPVENQATLGRPSSSDATVLFTPDKQGRYHVIAAFDPVGGIQQLDLYAARDRSTEAPIQTLPQLACNALERTQHGGWACDTDFLRNGTLVERFSGARLAVSGDVVWVVSPSQVQRFVDTGTALEPSGSLNQSQGSPLFLLASDDELVVLYGSTLQRITFDGTQLASTGLSSWTPSTNVLGPDGLQGLLLRTGDQLATVSGSLSQGSFVTLQICPYELMTGRFTRTAASCQLISSEVVGFEPNALWVGSRFTFANTFNDLRRLEWTGTGLVERASLPLGASFTLTTRGAGALNTLTPVILPLFSLANTRTRSFVPVYSTEQRGILFEVLDTDIADPSASPTLLWGTPSTGSSGLRIRIRPSTP